MTTQATTPRRWPLLLLAFVVLVVTSVLAPTVMAAPASPAITPVNAPLLSLSMGGETPQNEQVATALKIVALLTVLSLAPALLITLTSFTRIIIVLSFLRQALGTHQTPPNQVLVGLALFMTWSVMAPVADQIYTNAYQPFAEQRLSPGEALDEAAKPLRTFMIRYTREGDLALFLEASHQPRPSSVDEVPMRALIPAFMISELKTSFQIGFLIYLPFLIIDMVVASVLMAMGMMVLPPVMISLPFKLLLFVLVDGWNLMTSSLLGTFK